MQKLQSKIHRQGLLAKIKMVLHKCFECDKEIKEEYIKKKIRCPYCGSKILYKPRIISSKVKAE